MIDERGKPIAEDILFDKGLKTNTSRERAELISLVRASRDMKVIEVKEASFLKRNEFLDLMKNQVPVIFRSYASEWNCVKEWSKDNYLKQAAIEEALDFPHRKYRQFTAHMREGGRVHLTDGKSKAKPVSMEDFIGRADLDENVIGQYLLGIHGFDKRSSLIYCPVQSHQDDHGRVPPLARDVPNSIDFLSWYASYLGDLEGGNTPVPYDHQQFFLSRGCTFTDLHYDTYDNFYVATSGTRRWTIGCPTASRWFVSSSSVNFKSGSQLVPHKDNFMPGSPAQVYPFAYVDLSPGDMLFLPSCWWHLVESLPGENGLSSAFNFFFSKPPDKVYALFEESLRVTNDVVNATRRECRFDMAQCNKRRGVSLGETLKTGPKRIRQSLWDQLLALAKVHEISADLHTLFHLLNANSIFQFESRTHVPGSLTEPSRSRLRLSDVSTVPEETEVDITSD